MRPLGISILGVLVLLAAVVLILIGVASFFVGLAFLVPGSPIAGTTMLVNGVLYFFLGVVLGIAGSGLMMMRPWAWGLALLATLVGFVYLAYSAYQDMRAGTGLSLFSLLTLVFVGVIFVYLLGVSRAFRRARGTV